MENLFNRYRNFTILVLVLLFRPQGLMGKA